MLNDAVSCCQVVYPCKRNTRMLEAVDVKQKPGRASQNISRETSKQNSEQALASNQFGGIPLRCRCFPSLMKDGVIKYLATEFLETSSTINNVRRVNSLLLQGPFIRYMVVQVCYESSGFATHTYLLHVIRAYADNFLITKLITSACKSNNESQCLF